MRWRDWIDRRIRQRALGQWSVLADRAGGHGASLPKRRIRRLRDEAGALRRDLDRFVTRADVALATSVATEATQGLSQDTDWHWRPDFLISRATPAALVAPESGADLQGQATIWHDCADRAVILRQMPNTQTDAPMPFGLQLETFAFTGSFLSLAIDLPPDVMKDLGRRHILRLDMSLTMERETPVYVRLNVAHGPNTDDILRQIDTRHADQPRQVAVEFDLYLIDMNDERLVKLWLDIIVENPAMNALRITDLRLSRRPRAEV